MTCVAVDTQNVVRFVVDPDMNWKLIKLAIECIHHCLHRVENVQKVQAVAERRMILIRIIHCNHGVGIPVGIVVASGGLLKFVKLQLSNVYSSILSTPSDTPCPFFNAA